MIKKNNPSVDRLNFFLLADYAFLSADNKLGVIGIFEIFNVLNFPTKLSKFFVVTNLDLKPGKREIEIRIFDPLNKEIIPLGKKGIQIEGGRRVNTITDINFLPIKQEGFFTVSLIIDGQKIDEKKIEVKLLKNKIN